MENSTVGGQVKISINDIYQIKQKSFSKDPVTYRALKSNSWNYDSIAVKRYSINMFQI